MKLKKLRSIYINKYQKNKNINAYSSLTSLQVEYLFF
jgi:hypothetical protein